jgi:type IV pilus assembly protein PilB
MDYQNNVDTDLGFVQLSVELQQCITPEQAWHYHIIPKSLNSEEIEFYLEENTDSEFVQEELEVLFGKKVKLFQIKSDVLLKSLGKYFRKSDRKREGKIEYLENYNAEDFINKLIEEAKSIHSSDIHIEQYEDRSRVRFRIDGKLIERYIINRLEYPALINKIKIKADLDISEKRLPQDGRMIYNSGEDKFDIRVSVLPTLFGEKIVLRLLSRDTANIDINELGFSEKQLIDYLEGIKKTSGIVLISGPTGSGKTTTLYATLKILNKAESNILTIEDPIEYTLEGVNQVQLKESIGLSFASALRTFLRQDPDIIMLGEIRDSETAQMAIRAALTGHLVLSTIHTNSAWGTISRLIDMGVPPFLLSNTLNLSVAQRLVRLLCPSCKREEEISNNLFPKHFHPLRSIKNHYIPIGCQDCYFTGYKGRKAVYEVISVDTDVVELIKDSNIKISSVLEEKQIFSLADQSFDLLARGVTSIEEIYPILMMNRY